MKLRIAIFALLVTILLPISVLARPTTPKPAELKVNAPNVPAVRINPTLATATTVAGRSVLFTFTIYNEGIAGDPVESYNITFNQPAGWTTTANPNPVVNVPPGNSDSFDVLVSVPPGTAPGVYVIEVIVTGTVSGVTTRARLEITVVAPSPTPTATATLGTPTATIGSATPTPSNICDGTGGTRNDGYEPDNSKEQARRIEIDIPQQHALCPVGDEDWLIFGGLEGKVYTIDISQAVDGLDPSLTLYDEWGNQLAFNDDFPRNGDTTDVKPRIQSWRAPSNGQYYIKVRDAAGRGFRNALYTIILQSESYGPTPTLIPELCSDLFENDGLPSIAPQIVVGETHPRHRLCPRGDADWVKFFAKAGKVYSIFTSNLTVGADTVLVLADRDGTSILDFNDDYGSGLSSRIDFAPQVDGFYYAQVKNVGDVGNQFIQYDLTFQIISNANQGQPTTGPQPPTSTIAGPTDIVVTATLPPGVTPTATVTATKTYPGTAAKLPAFVIGQAGLFADPAFSKVWERSDAPIAANKVSRSWLWGPQSGNAMVEVYDEANGGVRQVQYFDKSRMEISNPSGDRSSQWFVTNGLIAKELISGQVQIGDKNFVKRAPAVINIAGDLDDKRAPTYASFSTNLAGVADQTGQYANKTLNRDGSTGNFSGKPSDAAKLVTYVPQTQHHIAGAFWEFINRRGLISENGNLHDGQIMDWVFALGYPISEPYWVRVRVGGVEQDVLVQAFERRVLTYTPNNPSDWRVEMGNVGQHYEQWRYK